MSSGHSTFTNTLQNFQIVKDRACGTNKIYCLSFFMTLGPLDNRVMTRFSHDEIVSLRKGFGCGRMYGLSFIII